MIKPDCQVGVDGIDYIYTEQNRCLTCTICFFKIVVSDEAIAKIRLAMAHVVRSQESGVYLNVSF